MKKFFKFTTASLILCILGSVAAHHYIAYRAKVSPPEVSLGAKSFTLSEHNGIRVAGPAYATRYGGIWLARLDGSPEAIGFQHAKLLYPEMVRVEARMLESFKKIVPLAPIRTLIKDLALLRYNKIEQSYDGLARRELAAQAVGFQPDPFSGFLPTYQRYLNLAALYDVSLSFEYSPLIGCTTFVGKDQENQNGILARNFDFETDDIFDTEKVVFVVSQPQKKSFISVAWPGMVGVVSGMNEEGVSLVVHGARAGEPRTVGVPVLIGLRRALEAANNSEEAVAILSAQEVMVSHIIVVNDPSGDARVIERVPGQAAHIRKLAKRSVITNHLEGPSAADAKNLRVRHDSSTLARRARGDELVSSSTPSTALEFSRWLRDKRGLGGSPLERGDRNAIDADIATHGVVFETQARRVWVSSGPHLNGSFIEFDLNQLLHTDSRNLPEVATLDRDYDAVVAADQAQKEADDDQADDPQADDAQADVRQADTHQ